MEKHHSSSVMLAVASLHAPQSGPYRVPAKRTHRRVILTAAWHSYFVVRNGVSSIRRLSASAAARTLLTS